MVRQATLTLRLRAESSPTVRCAGELPLAKPKSSISGGRGGSPF